MSVYSRSISLGAALAALLAASGAMAQDLTMEPDGNNGLRKGAKSLAFTFPGGGNAFASGAAGVWYMVSRDINLGFNVGLKYDPSKVGTQRVTSWSLLLAPALKYYISTGSALVPFGFGQVNIKLSSDGNDNTSERPELALAGGFGVEYFLRRQLSVGGQVGLVIDVVRQEPAEPIALQTFTSSLTLSFYFD